MWTLIFITCARIFAYNCCEIDKNFRGSSASAKLYIGFTGTVCYFATIALFVWSFWKFDWWQPIVAFVGSIILGGFSGIFFQRNLIGTMLSPVLAIVFTVLGVVGLILE